MPPSKGSHTRNIFRLAALAYQTSQTSSSHVRIAGLSDQSLLLNKQRALSPDPGLESKSLVPSMNDTKFISDQASTNLTTPSTEPEATETEKHPSGQAGSTANAASSPPRASSDSNEIQDKPLAERNNAFQVDDAAEIQPKPPTRSLTQTISDPKTFERLAEMFNSVCQEGGREQPLIVNNFGNIAKLEIINGSLARSEPPSTIAASVVATSQKNKTTKLASLLGWIAKLPRPKPFIVWRTVKDADDNWQCLEVFLDTGGGAGNLIPYSQVRTLGLLDRIKPSSITIYSLGGNELKVEGSVEIVGKWDGSQEQSVPFFVVDRDNKHVTETTLGADSIGTFKLVRIRFGMTTKGPVHGVTPNKQGNETNPAVRLFVANKEQ